MAHGAGQYASIVVAAYRISERAEADILAILRYSIEAFGEHQARIYYQGLADAVTFLSDNPYAARERAEISPPIRAHRYQSHLIVYEVDADGAPVILRIVHGSMDWAGEF